MRGRVAIVARQRGGGTWSTVDVDADPEDRAEYGDRVPVILVDGVEHGYYRVEPDRCCGARWPVEPSRASRPCVPGALICRHGA